MARRKLSSAALRRGDHVADWVERFCCHIKGDLAGKPLKLEEWQRQWVREVFGPAQRDGRRKIRTALLGVPRKNGKSTLAAAVALYLLFADGEAGCEVYSAAADRDQARAVFDTARQMVEASPALSKHAKVCRSWIEVPASASLYRVLSADARRHHGLNPHGVVIDELHAQPNRELYDVLTSGQGARAQPLTVAITTAGFDRQSICYELYEYGRQLEAGIVDDDRWHFRWYGAPDEADWQDPKVWAAANPNLGIAPSLEFLEGEMATAAQQPARQNAARRLYLNQWVQADVRWLDLGLWDENAGLTIREDDLAGRRCFGGLDLASTSDFAALVWVFPDDETGEQRVLPRFWLPRAAVEKRSSMRATLQAWEREGHLMVTDGDVIDYGAVLDQFDRDAQRFDVAEVAFDPWNATQLTQELHDGGMTVWPCRQTITALTGPSKELERLLGERRLRHGGHPVLRWMADNVTTTTDSSGNIKPDKKRSTEKIDGIVALVMAVAASIREREASVAPFVMHL